MGWSFINSNEAWYKDVVTENELILEFHKGKVSGEFSIVWIELGNKLVPQLKVFNDAWFVLYHHGQKLLEKLSVYDNLDVSKEKLIQELLWLGFKDETQYEQKQEGE
jgi:hypothetical protein